MTYHVRIGRGREVGVIGLGLRSDEPPVTMEGSRGESPIRQKITSSLSFVVFARFSEKSRVLGGGFLSNRVSAKGACRRPSCSTSLW